MVFKPTPEQQARIEKAREELRRLENYRAVPRASLSISAPVKPGLNHLGRYGLS